MSREECELLLGKMKNEMEPIIRICAEGGYALSMYRTR